jgi:fibronectin type 3 domain-containing protein
MKVYGDELKQIVLPLVLALYLAGCATVNERYFQDTTSQANVYVAPVPAAIHKIAVLPFKAPTELIGTSISDLFVTEMLRAGRYELVERSQMTKVLSESELSLAGLSAAKAAAVGQMLGADGVVIGTVDEYATVAQGGHPYPSVGISVRMIDCANGKVMWSADLAKVADSKKTTLPMEARMVAHELTAGLYQHWDVQPRVARRPVAAVEPASAPDQPVTRAPPAASPPAAEPPAPPADFKVSDLGLREARLTWSAPADGSLKYRIERGRTDEGPFEVLKVVSASAQEYRDIGLPDSTNFFYRLIAVAVTGAASKPSRVRESMTAPPPEPPPAIRATAPASRALSVTWGASPSEGVVRYVVERASAEAGPFVKVGEVEQAEFREGGTAKSELQDSTKYFYRLTSINRVGSVGASSQPVAVVTLPPPAPVSGLLARSDEVRCVPLTWTASPEADVVRYDIYRRESENAKFALITSLKGRDKTSCLDGGADPGNLGDRVEYEYTVRAINAVTAESADCLPVKAITRGAPPAVTQVVAASGQPRQVTLKWAESPDTKVTGYEIHRLAEDGATTNKLAEVTGRETLTFEDRGDKRWFGGGSLGRLKDGTEYKYQVIAFNTAHACAEPSETVVARTKPVPAKPVALAATGELVKSVRFTFRANPEKDIATYVIEAASAADGRFKEVGRVEATVAVELVFTEEKLSDGQPRHYRIKAIDKDTLESVWSEVLGGSSKPLPAPPAELKAAWQADTTVLQWTASPTKDVKQYKVWKKGFLSSDVIATVAATEQRLTREQVGKKSTVYVTAVDADGLESAPSAPFALMPP